MIILIAGDGHTGKTLLAQKLLERYGFPYLSIDHLKMGLIRSRQTTLTPESDDEALTGYLWPIVREIIKTGIENKQNLIIEGCYIPFNFREEFSTEYLNEIHFVCLIFSERYIEEHFEDIFKYETVIEQRITTGYRRKGNMKAANTRNLQACITRGLDYILIDRDYEIDYSL